MQIKLHRIHGDNALAYGEFDFIFDEHNVYQLIGKNGTGKSSLPVILEEVLFNNNSRGKKKAKIPNRFTGVTGWWAEVIFFIEDTKYVVRKDVKSTAKLKLTKDGEDISGHTATQTYKILKEILGGLDFKMFSKLVYQSLKSSMDFLTATDANRKKFLVSLLGLEHYAEIELKLKAALKDAQSKLDVLEDKSETIESWLKRNSIIPSEMYPIDVPTSDSGLEKNLNERLVFLRTIELENKSVDDHNKQVQQYKERCQKKDILYDKVTDLRKSEPAPAEDRSSEIQSVTRDLTEVRTSMNAQHKLYQQFAIEADKDKCPTCGNELNVEAKAHARDIAKENYTKLVPIREKINNDLEYLYAEQKKHEAAERWAYQYKNALRDFNRYELGDEVLGTKSKTDASELQAEIRKLKTDINKLKTDINSANEHNTEVLVNNARRDEVTKQQDMYRADLAGMADELNELREEVNELAILVKTFGNKGLIAYKIESNIKVFEDLINIYLSKFTDGQFALAFNSEGSKLEVAIYDKGYEADMTDLSSGEEGKVNLSTLLAIRNLMSIISKTELNLLFLDEVISVLDGDAMDVLVEIMLEEKHLNTFIVSHGYNHPLTQSIHLEKVDGVSKVIHG